MRNARKVPARACQARVGTPACAGVTASFLEPPDSLAAHRASEVRALQHEAKAVGKVLIRLR